MLISGRLELLRKSDMKLNIPFLDLVAVVPLRDRMPEEVCMGTLGMSGTGGSGGRFCTSGESDQAPVS